MKWRGVPELFWVSNSPKNCAYLTGLLWELNKIMPVKMFSTSLLIYNKHSQMVPINTTNDIIYQWQWLIPIPSLPCSVFIVLPFAEQILHLKHFSSHEATPCQPESQYALHSGLFLFRNSCPQSAKPGLQHWLKHLDFPTGPHRVETQYWLAINSGYLDVGCHLIALDSGVSIAMALPLNAPLLLWIITYTFSA